MKASIRLLDPDYMKAEVRLIASIGELREIRKHLGDRDPSWKFGWILSRAIQKAEESFDAQEEVAP